MYCCVHCHYNSECNISRVLLIYSMWVQTSNCKVNSGKFPHFKKLCLYTGIMNQLISFINKVQPSQDIFGKTVQIRLVMHQSVSLKMLFCNSELKVTCTLPRLILSGQIFGNHHSKFSFYLVHH